MKSVDRIKELRQLDAKALAAKAKELREEMFWLNFKNTSGAGATATSNIAKTRKDLARVLTLLTEKANKA